MTPMNSRVSDDIELARRAQPQLALLHAPLSAVAPGSVTSDKIKPIGHPDQVNSAFRPRKVA